MKVGNEDQERAQLEIDFEGHLTRFRDERWLPPKFIRLIELLRRQRDELRDKLMDALPGDE